MTTLAAAAGGSYYLYGGKRPEGHYMTLDRVSRELAALSQFRDLDSTGAWLPAQIFTHCAQSIDYSMDGYPEQYSETFKSTLGALAFGVFSARQKMSHGLDEPIPGAQALSEGADLAQSLEMLQASIARFRAYKGKHAPHFAYGDLSKEEYELAHVMHYRNHMDEIPAAQDALPGVVLSRQTVG